jgi:hypothetical protein
MLAMLGVAVVVVRIYDATGFADADRRVALDVAQKALAAANVHVVFKACRPEWSDGEACDTTPAPGERIVRIVNSPPHPQPGTETSLGSAAVDRVTNTGVLATIWADRVRRVAAGRTDQGLLLGRAIAHELGHLLLGAGAHSKSGLMRQYWTEQELRQNRFADWAFSAEDRWRICVKHVRSRSLCSGEAGSSWLK